ncbi:DUF6745 domain-containing protein [Embleya sp. NPDC008237]|uniref:DUF6745 domain-containing protein n=1 Tax=Embleya sp. NPDC008237 TaxID=3363978 RepID=UPI0036E018B2
MATPPRKLPGIALPRKAPAPRPPAPPAAPANPAAAAWAALRAREAEAARAAAPAPAPPRPRVAAPTPASAPAGTAADSARPAARGAAPIADRAHRTPLHAPGRATDEPARTASEGARSAPAGERRRPTPHHAPAPRHASVLGLADRLALAEATTDWAHVAAATGPADRPAAEEAIRAVYRAAGLPEPERVVWYDSPLAAAVAAAVAAGSCKPADLAATRLSVKVPGRPGRPVQERLWSGPWTAAKAEATALLGPAGWDLAWAEGADRLWEPTRQLTERIREAVHSGVGAWDPSVRTPASRGRWDVADKVRATTHSALGGQHDAAWLAVFDGLKERFPQFDFPVLAELGEVARHIGWWWPYERVVLVSERPTTMHRDDQSRLHNGDGPALTYADGFALHAWRGMPVPADFVGGLGPGGSRLTVRAIHNEDNAELRRVMLEIYGYDRYLREVGAQPLDRDETGVLWEIELDDDEPIVMVEVLNSTPEPDGSTRTYWLRVPPDTRTAREGVAWTFGLSPENYRPLHET